MEIIDQIKKDLILQNLQAKVGNKNYLNLSEMLKAIDSNYSAFQRARDKNDLSDFPKYLEKKEYKRQGNEYNTYKFELSEIVIFLLYGKELYNKIHNKN